MLAVSGTDKAFSTNRKPNVQGLFGEETALEKAAQPEKIKRATGSDIEFHAVKGLEELSGNPFVAALNSIWIQGILSIMLVMCGVACLVSLRIGQEIEPGATASKITGTYKSADSLSTIDFQNDNKVAIWKSGERVEGTFNAARGSSDDLIQLLSGYLKRKTVFYKLFNDNCITDNEGRKFFREGAPEQDIIKMMWSYAKFAQEEYRSKHSYPVSNEAWFKDSAFKFVNPFTGRTSVATITPVPGAGTSHLALTVGSGQMYPGELPPDPGAIRCIVFDKIRFFIRGFGEDGEAFAGTDPNKIFYIELTDGDNITEKFLQDTSKIDSDATGQIPTRVVVLVNNSNLENNFHLATSIVPAFAGLFMFTSLLMVAATLSTKKRLQWYHYFSTTLAALIMIAWLVLALR